MTRKSSPTLRSYGDFAKEFDASDVISAYEIGRPTYPIETIQEVLSILRAHGLKSTDLTAIDGGTGTGLLSRSMLEGDSTAVRRIHAFDRPNMVAAASANPLLSDAIQEGRLSVTEARFDATGLGDASVDVYLAAQSLHWGTRDESDYPGTLAEILRVLRDGASLFAVYNAPIATTTNSFTAGLNDLLNSKCPDPYYQALTSGSVGTFLQNSHSNLSRLFFDLAQARGGMLTVSQLDNPTYYKDLATVKSYALSNAFVKGAIKKAQEAGRDLQPALESTIEALYERFKDDQGGVAYGNVTWLIGAVGLKAA